MNDTTFQGVGKVAYVPVVVNAKQKKPQTNADRIRAMSDIELAKALSKIHGTCVWCPVHEDCDGENCDGQLLDWLKEVSE